MIYDSINSAKQVCISVLELDNSIRFVGRIKDNQVLSFVRNNDASPLLDDEMGNMAHYQASVKASMEEMFDGALGMTNWMITSKENVKLITIFLGEGELMILSTEPDGNHDEIIKKIQGLNMKLWVQN